MNTHRDPSLELALADYPFAVESLASFARISVGLEPKKLTKAIRKAALADRENLHRLALTILAGTSPKLATAAEAFPPSVEK